MIVLAVVVCSTASHQRRTALAHPSPPLATQLCLCSLPACAPMLNINAKLLPHGITRTKVSVSRPSFSPSHSLRYAAGYGIVPIVTFIVGYPCLRLIVGANLYHFHRYCSSGSRSSSLPVYLFRGRSWRGAHNTHLRFERHSMDQHST
jgi:ABC-type Fe3+ transport system permease subunit